MVGRGRIAELFAPLLPPETRFAAMAIDGPEPALLEAIGRVVPKRHRTFAFGRACAREALGTAAAIPIGEAGAPVWPQGIVGSITHTDEHAAAAVSTRLRALGIDLESIAHAARTPGLLDMVTTPSERERFAGRVSAALVFSAKESVYKCLYPTAGRFLDFSDVELAIGDGTFAVLRAGEYATSELAGRFAIADDFVATAVFA